MHYAAGTHFTQPPTTQDCLASAGIACYSPNQLEQAYGMPTLYHEGLTGAGKTIVLVDSYGSPTITADLAKFDSDFGLPAPPSFKIIQPVGAVPPYDPSKYADQQSWDLETSLDVEYAHAMAPGANIILDESPVDETEGTVGLPQMMDAEVYVIDHHMADVISQSFGATEETFPSARSVYDLRYAFEDALFHNVTVLAASGDGGSTDQTAAPDEINWYPFRVNSWPSADPLVTSVGGTQLHLDADGNRLAPDNVWNDGFALCGAPCAGGGGVSEFFSRPFYQDEVARTVGDRRGTPDVAMSAAVNGGALVYSSSFGSAPAYYIVGGTSEASPLFSGVVAVADQAAGHDLGLLNPTLYADGDGSWSGLTDITIGNNTASFTNQPTDPYPGPHVVPGFQAVPGYDLASGLGTANGPKLVAELASNRHGWHRR